MSAEREAVQIPYLILQTEIGTAADVVEIPAPLPPDTDVEINLPDDAAAKPVLGVDFGATDQSAVVVATKNEDGTLTILDEAADFERALTRDAVVRALADGHPKTWPEAEGLPVAESADFPGTAASGNGHMIASPEQPPMLDAVEPDLVYVKKGAPPLALAAAAIFAKAAGTKVAVHGEKKPQVDKVPRTLIRGMAVPVAWVRSCADQTCEICEGDGFVAKEGQKPIFCRCALVRANQRIEAVEKSGRIKLVDPPPVDEIPRAEVERQRHDRKISGLARQIETLQADLTMRDRDSERAIAAMEAAEADRRARLQEDANRARVALQDASTAELVAAQEAKTLRVRIAEAEAELARLRRESAGAEAKHVAAVQDMNVAAGLAEEAGRKAADLTSDLERRVEAQQKRHAKNTDGARRELEKLRRRMAIAEARR